MKFFSDATGEAAAYRRVCLKRCTRDGEKSAAWHNHADRQLLSRSAPGKCEYPAAGLTEVAGLGQLAL
jgi:hypothetical protein